MEEQVARTLTGYAGCRRGKILKTHACIHAHTHSSFFCSSSFLTSYLVGDFTLNDLQDKIPKVCCPFSPPVRTCFHFYRSQVDEVVCFPSINSSLSAVLASFVSCFISVFFCFCFLVFLLLFFLLSCLCCCVLVPGTLTFHLLTLEFAIYFLCFGLPPSHSL